MTTGIKLVTVAVEIIQVIPDPALVGIIAVIGIDKVTSGTVIAAGFIIP